jgi:hypothetical protein
MTTLAASLVDAPSTGASTVNGAQTARTLGHKQESVCNSSTTASAAKWRGFVT